MTGAPIPKEFDVDAFIKSSPLFMNELPDNLDDYPELAALQALAFDGSPTEIAENFKNQGNDHYNAKNYREALGFYKQGLEQEIENDLLHVLQLNMAQAHLKLENYKSCYSICLDVLSRDRYCEKAYFRALQALLKCDRVSESYELAKVANHFCKNDFFEKTVKECLKKKIIQERHTKRTQKQLDIQQQSINNLLEMFKQLSIPVVGDFGHSNHIPCCENDILYIPVTIRTPNDPILFEKVDTLALLSDLLEMSNLSGKLYADIDHSGHYKPLPTHLSILEALKSSCLLNGHLSLFLS